MSRYTRHQPSVIRECDASDDWMKQLEKNLERSAVEPHKDKSIYDQITSIMNNKKSKFSSVEDAVQDMRERSGLTAYLEKVKKAQQSFAEKKAQAENGTPSIFTVAPTVKNTLENFVHETRGNATVPAIIEKLKEIHRMDIPDPKHWEDDNLVRYVSNLNAKEKQKYPRNEAEYIDLGKAPRLQDKDIDTENTDAFHSLMPATK